MNILDQIRKRHRLLLDQRKVPAVRGASPVDSSTPFEPRSRWLLVDVVALYVLTSMSTSSLAAQRLAKRRKMQPRKKRRTRTRARTAEQTTRTEVVALGEAGKVTSRAGMSITE